MDVEGAGVRDGREWVEDQGVGGGVELGQIREFELGFGVWGEPVDGGDVFE